MRARVNRHTASIDTLDAATIRLVIHIIYIAKHAAVDWSKAIDLTTDDESDENDESDYSVEGDTG